MPLLINNKETEQLLDMTACMDVLEAAFKEEGLGWATNRTKSNISVPTDDPNLWYRYCSMEGGIKSLGVVAIRIKTDMYSWPFLHGRRREIKYCGAPGNFCGLILLFSTKNGEPLALLNDGYIQHMRVAATAGLAARYMARQESTVLGILGSGGMARTHALAYALVRPLVRIKVYSPNPQHRNEFAKEMSKTLGADVVPMENPESAVKGSDIVAVCTDAVGPALSGTHLEPGMHLTTVRETELAEDAYPCISRFVEYRAGICEQHYATPESHRPPSLGGSTEEWRRLVELIPSNRRHTLSAVLLGRAKGREDDRETNLFSSEGSGVQFAAVAWKIYEKARNRGLGRDLPLEWFLQDVRD